jgi:hypothetical protein
MKQFRVTIHMTFEPHYWDDDYYSEKMTKAEKKAKKAAFERTEKYYEEHSMIDYIKRNSAFGTVEYMFSNAEVKSAEWDPETFAIHMIVETDESEEEIRRDLEMNSLEDGEYEACGDTPWILFTRDKDGHPLGPPWDMKDFWEYGLVDYRQNPIEIIQLEQSTSQTS